MRISDWSSDVCSSDLVQPRQQSRTQARFQPLVHEGLGERRDFRTVEPGEIGLVLLRRDPAVFETVAQKERNCIRKLKRPDLAMPGEVRDEQAFAAGTLQQRSIHIDEDDAQLPNLLPLPVSAKYPLPHYELDTKRQSAAAPTTDPRGHHPP